MLAALHWPSHLAVRWLHVLAVAVLVGGSALSWAAARRVDGDAVLAVATTYEWLFWGALGVAVLTGVGNLGALAPAVPGPGTRWARTFAAKLAVVVLVVLGSVVRTVAVVRLDRTGGPPGDADHRLGRAYGVTAVALVVLVGLAEVLAHG